MSVYREYVVCSNPSCRFSAQGNDIMYKGCPLCGMDLIYKCPKCGSAIWHKGALYCHECRAPIKPQEEEKSLPHK